VDDAERRLWLLSAIAAESRAHVSDLDGLGAVRFGQGQAFIDAGYYMELFSKGEADRLSAALLAKETDDHVFLDLRD